MSTTDHIKFGDGLTVTDEGSGVIRVDSLGVIGPAGPPGGIEVARPKGGGTTYIGVPGETFLGTFVTTNWWGANNDIYFPFSVAKAILVDTLYIEVTGAVAGSNFRIGIYAADADFQPVGAPLMDSGNISGASTGVKTYTPGSPVTLAAGNYLTVYNVSANNLTLRMYDAPLRVFLPTLGGSNFGLIAMSVGRTYAAFPTPGTPWTTAGVGTKTTHNTLMRWTPT
jgi:hypothetical protein